MIQNQKTETIKIKREIMFKKEYHENLNVNDISQKKNVTVVDLLNNVKNRFYNQTIFTYVGNEILILNPNEEIPGLFSEERMDKAMEVLIL
jgi:myosin heavy subunit